MSRTALFLGILNLMAAGAGFLREAVIAYRFGASAASDALAIALLLVESIMGISFFGLACYMMVPVIVPLMDEDRESAFALMECLCLWTVIACAPLTIPGLLVPEFAARALAPQFSQIQLRYLSQLLTISALAIPLVAVAGIMAGLLQAASSYSATAIGRLLFSSSVAVSILVAPPGSRVIAGGLGLTVGAALLMGTQIVGLYRYGWRLSRIPRLKHPSLGAAWRLGLPAVSIFFLVSFVLGNLQRVIASGLPEGSITSVNYAMRASSLVTTFTTAVATVALTELTNSFVLEGLGPTSVVLLSEQILGAAVWLMPISIILFAASEPITWLLFKRGQFNASSVVLCATCLRWFSLSLVPGLVLGILMRAYASFWLPWRAVAVAALWVAASSGSTWLLLEKLGAASVPAGFLIGTTVACLVNLVDLGRLAGDSRWTKLRTGALRMLIPALAAVAFGAWCTVPTFAAPPWAVHLATLSMRSFIVFGICLGGGLFLREPALITAWARARAVLNSR